ncbi:MAG: prepilin-type N-terminal cleavage/methylation domain-containing protein [Pseudomonadota bacterium]
MNNAPRPLRRRQAGFTLLEALVAFLVMAFGMLAIAGFQTTMSRNSDVAKQRSEAVRLGQQKIESLRTFQQVTSDGAGTIVNFEDDVVAGGPEIINPSSADAYATNTTYTRQWWITKNDGVTVAGTGDLEKWLLVQVSWTDRAGDPQSVSLRSVISRSDPIDLGTLFTGPNGTKPRTPKNRNINIPYPAVALGGGKTSAFQPPGSGNSYVFDNPTGDVLGYCTFALAAGATVSLEDGNLTTGCFIEKAYIVSGYIQFLNSVPTGGTESGRDNAISNSTTDTKELTVGIDFVGAAGTVRECSAQRQKVVSVGAVTARTIATASRSGTTVTVQTTGNHGFDTGQVVSINGTTGGLDGSFTITKLSTNSFSYTSSAGTSSNAGTATLVQELTLAESATAPSGYNDVKSRFVAYICIVRPYDDGDATTVDKWSGQIHLTPQPTDSVAWSFAATGAYKVCRFTGDYTNDNQMANSEHPLYYRGVTGALDNQNYLVVPSSESCPTDDESAPINDDYINTNAVLHQNTVAGVAPYGGLPSQGTQWGGSTGGEPADTSTPLPMFAP